MSITVEKHESKNGVDLINLTNWKTDLMNITSWAMLHVIKRKEKLMNHNFWELWLISKQIQLLAD